VLRALREQGVSIADTAESGALVYDFYRDGSVVASGWREQARRYWR
jgi:hypothetical protein